MRTNSIVTTITITTNTSLTKTRRSSQPQLPLTGDTPVYHKLAQAIQFITTITLQETLITTITTTTPLDLTISRCSK